MSDIDIERLREAVRWLPDYAAAMAERDDLLLAPLEDVEAAIRFLLDLADEGGELWRITDSCAHPEGWPAVSGCDGGSCVRVWPKEGES